MAKSSARSTLSKRHFAPLWIALAALTSLGCASSMPRTELVAQLRAVGARHGQAARIVPIHADSQMEAWARLGDARTQPNDALSRSLGQQFRATRTRRMTFVVGGPYANLSDRVVLNALNATQGIALPGLTLVYVSPEPPSEALSSKIANKRARMLHQPLTR